MKVFTQNTQYLVNINIIKCFGYVFDFRVTVVKMEKYFVEWTQLKIELKVRLELLFCCDIQWRNRWMQRNWTNLKCEVIGGC